MLTDATVVLEHLHCIREKDGTPHSEPYIWPALLWVAASTEVGVAAPASNQARRVIKPDMRPGESADIVSSVGILTAHVEEGFRAIILVVALWEKDETKMDAVTAGFKAFSSELRAAVASRLLALNSPDEEVREQAIKEIRKQVDNKVRSAIEGEIILPRDFDDVIGINFMALRALPDSSASIPISLGFGEEAGGRLLLFHDTSQSVGVPLAEPKLIGFSGWADFKFLFAGANQTIYAVDELRQGPERYEIEGHLEVQ